MVPSPSDGMLKTAVIAVSDIQEEEDRGVASEVSHGSLHPLLPLQLDRENHKPQEVCAAVYLGARTTLITARSLILPLDIRGTVLSAAKPL